MGREAIDRQRLARWKRQRRSGNGLPKRINNHLKAGAALIREAKGTRRLLSGASLRQHVAHRHGRERRAALVEVAGLSQGCGYLAQRSLAGAALLCSRNRATGREEQCQVASQCQQLKLGG